MMMKNNKTLVVSLLLLLTSGISAQTKNSDKLINEVETTFNASADKMELLRDEAFVAKVRKIITKGGTSAAKFINRNNDLVYVAQMKDDVKSFIDGMSTELRQSEDGRSVINSYYAMSDIAVGQKVPDFTLETPDGKQVNFYTYIKDKKCVLLDFWASWCGWCRKETPGIKRVYAEFKDKGFDVLSVSFDDKRDRWLKAVDEEAVEWTQVSDLKGIDKSDVARWYGISSIPAIHLIAPDGTALALKLRGTMINKAVEKAINE